MRSTTPYEPTPGDALAFLTSFPVSALWRESPLGFVSNLAHNFYMSSPTVIRRYIWLQSGPLADNIYGGGLQAHLWLALHKRDSRPQIQHNSARAGPSDRPKDRAHLQRMRAKRVVGGSREIDVRWRQLAGGC